MQKLRAEEHTSGHDVVDNKDSLALGNGIALDLEEVGAVLLLVALSLELAGKLALLSDGNETSIETKSERRTKQETARLETDNDVGGLVELCANLELEGLDEVCVELWRGEDGHNVLEENALGGEIGVLSQSISQSYFKIGEFGGTGGRGGGLASFGAMRVQLGVRCRGGGVRLGRWRMRSSRCAVDVLSAGALVFRVAVRRV